MLLVELLVVVFTLTLDSRIYSNTNALTMVAFCIDLFNHPSAYAGSVCVCLCMCHVLYVWCVLLFAFFLSILVFVLFVHVDCFLSLLGSLLLLLLVCTIFFSPLVTFFYCFFLKTCLKLLLCIFCCV